MKRIFLFITTICLAVTASAQYQVANSDFEEWESQTSETAEPCHWNSFKSASGGFTSFAGKQMSKIEGSDAHGGTASVKINARSVFGVIAQGNMTTGRINMGSMSATDGKNNYNYTDSDNPDYNQPFTGLPDAMEVYLYVSVSKKAKATALLHGDGKYYDPDDNNDDTVDLIAYATNTDISSTGKAWQKFVIPCEYNLSDGTRPSYAFITFSTSATPGEGNSADYMYIDDLSFLYYSELKSATYDGETIAFNGTTATIDEYYNESKLEITSNGHGATVETNMDEATQLLTITIKGDNISEDASNYHTYTIQFKTQPQYQRGDVNKDGEVSIADVTALVNIILGKAEENELADVNEDGEVSIADVTALVNIILGKN